MSRRRLDRATIVETAAALADSEGFEQLTLARVAQHLAIRTPSLYNHVTGIEGLRRDLALHGLRELQRHLSRATVGKATDDALIAFAHAYRAYAHEHPGVYTATVRVPAPRDSEWETLTRELLAIILAILSGYGLAGDDALHAIYGLRALLHGFVSLEAAGGFGLPLDLDESFDRLLKVWISGLHQSATE